MPIFWIALVAFYLLFFRLGWLPGGGRLDPAATPPAHITGLYTVDALLHGQWGLLWQALRHLVLPGLVLAIYTVGMLTRFTRASMLEIMGNDYVRAARLKGLPEHVVILRHVLRPALISIITVAGLAFAGLLSGTVLVENIFAWPGIGQYAYHSAVSLDLPAIMGVSLFIALVYIVLNLVIDLLYGVIDPRIPASSADGSTCDANRQVQCVRERGLRAPARCPHERACERIGGTVRPRMRTPAPGEVAS